MIHQEIRNKFNQLKAIGVINRASRLGGNDTPIEGPDGNQGFFHTFQAGSIAIYWSPKTGAHEIHGLIKHKYDRLKPVVSVGTIQKTGTLGFPTSDETLYPSTMGKFNTFEFGHISWKSQANEAFAVFREVLNSWKSQRLEVGPFGFPISDTVVLPCNGSFNNFERGTMYASKSLGAKNHLGKCVLVTNCAPIPIRARFYDPMLPTFNLINTLPNGRKTIAVTQTELFPIPANLSQVKVIINGNTPRPGNGNNVVVLGAGNNFVFKTDERVKITNKTSQPVRVKITNSSDPFQTVLHSQILGPTGNGNHPIAPDNLVYEMTDDVDSIKLYFDDLWETTVPRGSDYRHTVDRTRFRVISNSSMVKTIRFYELGDRVRLAPLLGSQDVIITPRSNTMVKLPTGKTSIQITIDLASPQVVTFGQTVIIP